MRRVTIRQRNIKTDNTHWNGVAGILLVAVHLDEFGEDRQLCDCGLHGGHVHLSDNDGMRVDLFIAKNAVEYCFYFEQLFTTREQILYSYIWSY